jgi:hypothetical protein
MCGAPERLFDVRWSQPQNRFCYVMFNSHMFNASRFNSEKDVPLIFFSLNKANTCVALPNAWRRSVRSLS